VNLTRILIFFFLLVNACATQNKNKKNGPSKFQVKTFPLPTVEIGNSKIAFQTGGFSGISLLSIDAHKINFRTHSDRGPNGQEIFFLAGVGKNVRVYPLPEFEPYWIDFQYDLAEKKVVFMQKINLQDSNGHTFSGLPPENSKAEVDKAVDVYGKIVHRSGALKNALSFDFEGICRDQDGDFWMSDEYYPGLVRFNAKGVLIENFAPTKNLAADLMFRKMNRGFEGIACYGNSVFLMLQSPMKTPGAKNRKAIRFIEFEIKSKKQIGTYVYLLDDENADKIGDLVTLDGINFYTIEQNSKSGKESVHKLIHFELDRSKNLQIQGELNGPPENWTVEEINRSGVALKKEITVDLGQLGLTQFEKIEALAMIDRQHFLMLNDNDFGIIDEVDLSKGQVKEDPEKKSYLIDLKIETN
jgi:hypothetical protein